MTSTNSNILQDKYAIVTGAAGGIGSEIAMTLARAGAKVALLDCDNEGLEQIAARIKKDGYECLIVEVNLRSITSIKQSVEKLFDYHEAWDILVNNAGICIRAPLLEFSSDDWDLLIDVNLRAVFVLSRLVAKKMITKQKGKIINVSSNASFYGTPESGPYAVTKAGINQLTKTMAVEWGQYNIQVNAICPTITMTKMAREIWDDPKNLKMKRKLVEKIPLKRFAELNDIMPLVLFLSGPGSNYINGAIIPIDNGAQYNPG